MTVHRTRWQACWAAAVLVAAGCDRAVFLADTGAPAAPDPPRPPVDVPRSSDPTPTEVRDGAPAPMEGVYRDKGAAPSDQGIRGLISFPIRDLPALERALDEMYDPRSPEFRRYMTPEQWIERHAPPEGDVALVASWLRSRGFEVPRVATNRLFIQFTGTVGQFNETFGAEVRVLERKSPRGGNPPHDVYGFEGGAGIQAPRFVQERIAAIATLDLPAATGTMPGEFGGVTTDLPPGLEQALTPAQVLAAYGARELHARGQRGKGVRLGVAIGASFRWNDLRTFWRTFGVNRADPKVIETMEPAVTRYFEGTLDIEWAGAMAPDAELLVYQGPDARNTSMVFTYNEAIARGDIDVLTDSFAHREDSEPRAVREAYGASSIMAAALGITVLAASGDSAGVDVPSSSPHVTAVGGTVLEMDGLRFGRETAWSLSGSGDSRTFEQPSWQRGVTPNAQRRAVVDLAANAETGYWTHYLGLWRPNTGTSYASPIVAGLIACVNGARAGRGLPRAGWLNPLLYTRADVQRTFRDITVGGTSAHAAEPGWDYPTGWGAPDAAALADALP